MVFGKRGSADSSDEIRRQQPPHIRRLIDAMQSIFDDASRLATAIRRDEPMPPADAVEPHLSPIRCAGSERLFAHADQNGQEVFTTYHFTTDFNKIDPSAQLHLQAMYGRIYTANLMAGKHAGSRLPEEYSAALTGMLDDILAKSAYYISFFRGHARSTRMFVGRLDEADVNVLMREHIDDWTRQMQAAKAAMTRPERLGESVPERQPCFLLAASGPYQEGQKVINGVHFTREHAEPLLAHMAAEQARAMGARAQAVNG